MDSRYIFQKRNQTHKQGEQIKPTLLFTLEEQGDRKWHKVKFCGSLEVNSEKSRANFLATSDNIRVESQDNIAEKTERRGGHRRTGTQINHLEGESFTLMA